MTLSAFESEKAECAGYLFSILAAAFCSAFQLLAQHSLGIGKHLERKSYGAHQYQAHLTMILAPQVLPAVVVFHWLNSCLRFCFVFVFQLGVLVWYRIRMFQFTFSIIFMAFSKHGMMVLLFLINVKLLLWVFCYGLLTLKCKIQSLVKAKNRNNIYWVSKTWRYLTFCKHFQV